MQRQVALQPMVARGPYIFLLKAKRAKELGETLKALSWVDDVEDVETNIVIFSVKQPITDIQVMEKLKEKGILIYAIGKGKIRLVTHLDYKQVMHEYVLETLMKLSF